MSTSRRQQLASRRNGAKSKGPKTPEGKQISSHNAIRHGMLANTTVLRNEDPDAFQGFLAHFLRRFGPLDDVEFGMIEEMVVSQWRMRRGWAIETEMMNEAIGRQPRVSDAPSEVKRIAAAFSELASKPELALLHRYETRLNRIYQRAFRNLMEMRAARPAEPVKNEECETNLVPETNTAPPPAQRPQLVPKSPAIIPSSPQLLAPDDPFSSAPLRLRVDPPIDMS